jgi:hypothetical protein
MSPANGHANDSANIPSTAVQQIAPSGWRHKHHQWPDPDRDKDHGVDRQSGGALPSFSNRMAHHQHQQGRIAAWPGYPLRGLASLHRSSERAVHSGGLDPQKYTIHTSANFERSKDQKIVAKVLVTRELTIFGLGSHSATGEEWADDDNAATAAEAQSFKRASSCFGLGRYLYYFTGTWVDLDDRKRPRTIPKLPDWATPEGWRRGLRPNAKVDSMPAERPTAPTDRNSSGYRSANGVSDAGRSLVQDIEQMEQALGKRMYRGRSPGSLRSCVRCSTPPPTRYRCSPISRSLSLSLPPTIDCLPCFLDSGHVVFSDDDREYFARSLDCRRIHSVACRSLQTPTQSAEFLPVSAVLPWLHSSDDP